MSTTQSGTVAAASGTFRIGGDLTVHRLGFGAMRITDKGIWGEPAHPEEAKRVLLRSVELGINFIDTADSYCEQNSLGFIPWFPVDSGKLARPGGPLDKAAQSHKASVAQLALAWLLKRSPVMLPIPGTSSVAHLEENTQAAELELTAEEFDALTHLAS
jgi:aryl-alcohol dehydrogenase-like predicted oxidoreductase